MDDTGHIFCLFMLAFAFLCNSASGGWLFKRRRRTQVRGERRPDELRPSRAVLMRSLYSRRKLNEKSGPRAKLRAQRRSTRPTTRTRRRQQAPRPSSPLSINDDATQLPDYHFSEPLRRVRCHLHRRRLQRTHRWGSLSDATSRH